MNNDSKYTDLKSTLKAVGKKVFVDFYYDFKDSQITTDELAEKLFTNNPLSISSEQRFRIPRARHIFETNQQIDALNIIIESGRLASDTIEKAKEILTNEVTEQKLIKEHEEETEFIQLVNSEVVYNSIEQAEYNKSQKRPKYATRTSVQPIRDIKVSRNALFMADYLCEIDNSHYVFKRKNSNINYTEPHHLIPLSAQRDFPDNSLDCEQNIVSLCCNCHKQVHYGSEIDSILKPLYEKRYKFLKEIGIDITFDRLKKYY